MEKKHILQIGGGTLIKRGVEKYLQNINSEMNYESIVMDVLTPGKCLNTELKDDIEKSGGKIIELKYVQNKLIYYIDFCMKLSKYLKDNSYDVIEAQTGSIPIMALSAYVGRKRHVKKIIVHTQNTHEKNWKYKLQSWMCRSLLIKADYFFACSMKAGQDSFPACVHSKIKVIPNAIDVQKYQFDLVQRETLRRQLNIENKFVIGHIGAFTKQKNHDYLIDVFSCVRKQREDSVLLLIGEGELQHEVKEKVKQHHLGDKVIFFGISNEIPKLLSCMDVFVFPSTWEGLGIVIVEAQANGLPCVYSKSLPEEVYINDNCCAMDIESAPENWAAKILKIGETANRAAYNENVYQSDFSLKKVVGDLEKIYLSD